MITLFFKKMLAAVTSHYKSHNSSVEIPIHHNSQLSQSQKQWRMNFGIQRVWHLSRNSSIFKVQFNARVCWKKRSNDTSWKPIIIHSKKMKSYHEGLRFRYSVRILFDCETEQKNIYALFNVDLLTDINRKT